LSELREARAARVADVDPESRRQRRTEQVTREREKARRRPLGLDDPRYR
jgi:hypothetical protein